MRSNTFIFNHIQVDSEGLFLVGIHNVQVEDKDGNPINAVRFKILAKEEEKQLEAPFVACVRQIQEELQELSDRLNKLLEEH